jgi:hypothetical protein
LLEERREFGSEIVHQPTIGRYSLHDSTNENDLRLIGFAAGSTNGDQEYVLHVQTNPPRNLALSRRPHPQPDRALLDIGGEVQT